MEAARGQEGLDAADVAGALLLEGFEFAMELTVVFLLGGWDVDNMPDIFVARSVANEHGEQLEAVEAVGLGATGPSGNLDARGVDDQVVNAGLGKEAIESEGVPVGFVAAQDGSVVGKAEALSSQADLLEQSGEVGGGDGTLTGAVEPGRC